MGNADRSAMNLQAAERSVSVPQPQELPRGMDAVSSIRANIQRRWMLGGEQVDMERGDWCVRRRILYKVREINHYIPASINAPIDPSRRLIA